MTVHVDEARGRNLIARARGLRPVAFYLAAGVAATDCAAAASLLVDGVDAKRIVWAAVGGAVALGVGVWRGLRLGVAS